MFVIITALFLTLVVYQTVAKTYQYPLISSGLNRITMMSINFFTGLGELVGNLFNIREWYSLIQKYVWQPIRPLFTSAVEIIEPIGKLAISPYYFLVGLAKTHFYTLSMAIIPSSTFWFLYTFDIREMTPNDFLLVVSISLLIFISVLALSNNELIHDIAKWWGDITNTPYQRVYTQYELEARYTYTDLKNLIKKNGLELPPIRSKRELIGWILENVNPKKE